MFGTEVTKNESLYAQYAFFVGLTVVEVIKQKKTSAPVLVD
jgi:hypothetical protein